MIAIPAEKIPGPVMRFRHAIAAALTGFGFQWMPAQSVPEFPPDSGLPKTDQNAESGLDSAAGDMRTGFTITGKIRSQYGENLSGASVRLGESGPVVTTDPEGKFTMQIPGDRDSVSDLELLVSNGINENMFWLAASELKADLDLVFRAERIERHTVGVMIMEPRIESLVEEKKLKPFGTPKGSGKQ